LAMMGGLLNQMILRRGVGSMLSPRVNFCETNLISFCHATEKNMQKDCRYYDKSSYDDHCMFLHFDQFCDNIEAQEKGSSNRPD
jgi:hypothetical protein